MRYFIGTVTLMCAAIASVITGIILGCGLTIEYPLGIAFFCFAVPVLIYTVAESK